jgi:hypothetical protein
VGGVEGHVVSPVDGERFDYPELGVNNKSSRLSNQQHEGSW